jgi:hypothetical protein
MLRILAVSSAVAVALPACASDPNKNAEEFANLGRSNASSEPPAGILAPVLAGDMTAVARRGRLLVEMDRALHLAREQGLAKVGEPNDAVIMPVVDVDPGGKSAQVVFLRWPKEEGGDRKRVSADDATRWLIVSMLLEPERILDVERLAGKVVRHTGEHVHAGAIIEAAKQLEQVAPGRSFTMLSVLEQVEGGTDLVTRVYAFCDGEGPDVEVVVAPAKGKRKPPRLVSTRTTHPSGIMDGEQVTLGELDQPTAMTVARVMWRGADAEPVSVRTRTGAWRVMPADGRVTRDAG